jgi:hypothetical protein
MSTQEGSWWHKKRQRVIWPAQTMAGSWFIVDWATCGEGSSLLPGEEAFVPHIHEADSNRRQRAHLPDDGMHWVQQPPAAVGFQGNPGVIVCDYPASRWDALPPPAADLHCLQTALPCNSHKQRCDAFSPCAAMAREQRLHSKQHSVLQPCMHTAG